MLLQIHEPGQTPGPHEDENQAPTIGIDLGTTNSVLSVVVSDFPRIIRNQQGKTLTPSVAYYDAHGKCAAVGNTDAQDLIEIRSIKRLMGRGAEDLSNDILPFELEKPQTGGMVKVKVGETSLSPVEVSRDILKALKAQADAMFDMPVSRAVITVPAYFDDAARTATRDAARAAGLEVLRLVNEPTAAALAYGLDNGIQGCYAVYDLGGGTFDFSLLELKGGVFKVLSTSGDTHLGGDDFDLAFLGLMLESRKAESLNSAERQYFLAEARRLREALTEQESVAINLKDCVSTISRTAFEAAVQPLLSRTLNHCRKALLDADVQADAIEGIVLVGGATRMPVVQHAVAQFFNKQPLTDIDPDEAVARGAAVQAYALSGGASNHVLLDVTPLSLGLEMVGGLTEKVIDRNTAIPVARAQEFTTYQDGQTAMMIHVVQGERETVDANRSLARFELHGIPPMTAGAAKIEIKFSLDADGLLTVSAREKTTGVEQRIEVKPSYGLSEAEMAHMLSESYSNAQEDMDKRLLIEQRVEAERLMAALDAALKADGGLLDSDERSAVDQSVAALKQALNSEDRGILQQKVEDLEKITHPFAQKRMDRAVGQALEGKDIQDVS